MTERFTLLSELGRGGMGIVWKARDEESGSIVALKLLRETYAEDPDYVTRFERELELAKRIHSRNVVQVLGYGVRDGIPYLALEYVDGPSLRERLATHGPYSWPEAKALLAQVAQGLADAHAAGVVHRDLKPSNVLIGSDGVAKIADFGIAKGLDLTRVTGTSTLLGTPAYLAPEGPADERSDLYSLGVIAYEMLTGVVPFEGRTYQEVILRHVREAPDLDKLPPEARPVVGWLLAKDPAERPHRSAELLPVLWSGASVPVTAPTSAPSPALAATPAPAPASASVPARTAGSSLPALSAAATPPVVLVPRPRRRSAFVGLGMLACLLVVAGLALIGGSMSTRTSPTAAPFLAANSTTPTPMPTPLPTPMPVQPTQTSSTPTIPYWLERVRDEPIEPGLGLAGVQLGDPEQRAIDKLGDNSVVPSPVTTTNGAVLYYALMYKYGGVFLGVYTTPDTRTVQSIRLYDSDFNSRGNIPAVSGVTIGSTQSALLGAFGRPTATDEHYDCPGNDSQTTTYAYKGISFWVCHANNLLYLIDVP